MTYITLDWACDQIRAYEARHGRRPEYFLVTPRQAWALATAAAPLLNRAFASIDPIDSVRKGQAFLCGIPLKLFEVEHAPGQ
ncbi:hypothetical protein [Pseudomonas viridiflava]|uniref:hypothetical protein n=1 Tax=Pseudomonas viridiflava TaxID=33069 RepID=UPI000F01F467|nr:hypothetical protein [Pseudomonas viridiflava]